MGKEWYEVITDYLTNRTFEVNSGQATHTRKVKRGYPQGSVFGPYAWCIVFNQILETLRHLGYNGTAFMDDLCVVVRGNSRLQTEHEGTEVIKLVNHWCENHKLELASDKLKILLHKGKNDPRRRPQIKYQGKIVEQVHEYKYLGV